ncbi:hypothetical protein [Saccharothrix texasensis]|uniref:hypothetical protein n=1 Tax=Saccharothrix texasensis TaxID=103734 RepID=UPI0011CE4125|nr:hypothetical protein [Saccharothrix texasensis]
MLAILAASQTGLALLTVLVEKAPLALLVLRPQPEIMVLLTGRLPPMVIVLVAVPLRLLIHIAYYELGRWGGERLVSRTRAGAWALRALSRRWLGAALLVSCLVHQSTPVDMALGARGTARHRVIAALVFGVSLSSVLIVWLGTQLTPFSAEILEFLREHPLATAAVVSVLALVTFVLSALQLVKAARAARKEVVDEGRQ